MKQRLDQLLVARGYAATREKAQRLIRTGRVRVGNRVATKPGHSFAEDAEVSVEQAPQFVSRGGEKLQAALDFFRLEVRGKVCMDVGASTGGFTDCLLQHDARKVYAIDVGKGQLDWRLRKDARVVVMEGMNAREIRADWFDERPRIAVVDVSFISLTKVLPAVREGLAAGADIITLIKPQFEVGKDEVGKGGVVRNPQLHREAVATVRRFGTEELELAYQGDMRSPLKGPAGNIEFIAYWKTT